MKVGPIKRHLLYHRHERAGYVVSRVKAERALWGQVLFLFCTDILQVLLHLFQLPFSARFGHQTIPNVVALATPTSIMPSWFGPVSP